MQLYEVAQRSNLLVFWVPLLWLTDTPSRGVERLHNQLPQLIQCKLYSEAEPRQRFSNEGVQEAELSTAPTAERLPLQKHIPAERGVTVIGS